MLLLVAARPDPNAALQHIVTAAAAKYNVSFSLAVSSGGDSFAKAAGVIDAAGTGASPADRYAWGSITKTFTGAAVMRLLAEGRLKLDDPAQ